MDPIFLVLCLVPIVAAAMQSVLHPRTFSWREAVAMGLLCLFMVVVAWSTLRYAGARDVEVWNGAVSEKQAIRKDCPWGWVGSTDNHCTEYRTRSVKTGESCSIDSEGTRTCTDIMSTEYNYDFDWERRYWIVSDDIDLRLEYPRVDRQGMNTPPKFAAVSVGDPASKTVPYDNWVMGAVDSMFHEDGAALEQYAEMIPPYPLGIYDGINIDRVIPVGVDLDARSWSRDLSRTLSDLGPKKQMNAVVVVVDAALSDEGYALAVRRAWKGFKKNDAVVFVGVGPELSVQWARVLSWSSASIFDIGLQNAIRDLRGRPLTSEALNAALREHGMASYARRSMTEFEYLKNSIPVPGWLYALVALLSLGGTAGISYAFHRTEF